MKQKTIATRHLRTKIAAGYVLILFVIFGIVYIWLNEQHRRQWTVCSACSSPAIAANV